MGGERNELEDPLHVGVVEACLAEPLLGQLAHHSLGAGTSVDPGRLDADQLSRSAL